MRRIMKMTDRPETSDNCRYTAIDLVLRAIDRFIRHTRFTDGGVPLFIVGAPRSGTTLVYQLITHSLHTAYFCNLANRHPVHPAAATWLMRRSIREYCTDFTSEYGGTSGRAAPSQGDGIWSRWFGPNRDFCDPAALDEGAISEMCTTVDSVAGILDAPFANKSVANAVRVAALVRTFPRCVFVSVERDLLATARSQLVNIMDRASKAGSEWASARPRAYARLKNLPPAEKAIGQIHEIRNDLRIDLRKISSSRYLEVKYEEVCAAPADFVKRVRELWYRHGVIARDRHAAPPPFRVSAGKRLDPSLEQGLSDALASVCHNNMVGRMAGA
jgi:hypothetical protein